MLSRCTLEDGGPFPIDEAKRLEVLRRQRILDSGSDEVFDRVVQLAANLFGATIAAVSFLDADRMWFKARIGVPVEEVPRRESFCTWVVATKEPVLIEDASQDDRVCRSLLVTEGLQLRFYAGAPIIVEDQAIGSLCIADTKPRSIDTVQLDLLASLAAMVADTVQLRTRAYDRQQNFERALHVA